MDPARVEQALFGADYILLADSGADILRRYPDLQVDYLIGDFDSADQEMLALAKQKGAQCISLKPEKDETDTHAAVLAARKVGVDEIVLVGGTGGRLDHSLGNLNVLYALERDGITAWMLGSRESAFCVKQRRVQMKGIEGKTFSVFPVGEEAVVSIQGAKYPLENHTILLGDTLGVSNIARCDPVTLWVHRGTVVVLINDITV